MASIPSSPRVRGHPLPQAAPPQPTPRPDFSGLSQCALVGRPFRVENGAVVALRRRAPMVLRGRVLAGRWGRVRALHCCRRWCLVEHAD